MANDPRTRHGVAVQRRMMGAVPSVRATVGAAFGNQRADAQIAADRRTLVQHLGLRVAQAVEDAAVRGVPLEVAAYVLTNTMGANEAVRVQAMHRAVQIADGQRAGQLSPDWGTALQQLAASDAQAQRGAAAEAGLLDLAQRLTREDLALIDATYRAQGWGGVRALLEASGVHPDVIETATSTHVEAGSLAGVAQRIQERIQADAAAAQGAEAQSRAVAAAEADMQARIDKAIEAATPREGDSPAEVARKGGPDMRRLADPAFHETAREWLAQQVGGGKTRAQVLREQGLLADGMSPGEAFLHLEQSMREHGGPEDVINAFRRPFGPRAGQEDGIRSLSQVVREDENMIRAHVDGAKRSHLAQGVLDRLAAQDKTARAARERSASRPTSAPKEQARTSRPSGPSVRQAVEASFRQHGGVPKQRPAVGNALSATIALAAGHKPSEIDTSPSADRHIRAAADRMTTTPEAPSLRDTIASALEQHSTYSDTTEGATDGE